MHLFLTGFMGTGKTTVGRLLAMELDRPFIDLDATIEADQKMTIAEIFAQRGEREFRRLESTALQSLEGNPPSVVATGGGIVTVTENRDWMISHGISIWLDVPFEVLVERMGGRGEREARPLFASESGARGLFESRRDLYGDADLRIEVSSADSVAEITALIRQGLEERRCDT